MTKLKIPRIRFPKGAMEYPFCNDLIMAHLLVMRGIDHREMYCDSLQIQLNETEKSIAGVLRFPNFGMEKYREYGIQITKVAKDCDKDFIRYLESSLQRKTPVMAHFDAYYCKWDRACYQKRHNDHTVLVTGYGKRGKSCTVCDPYFNGYDKRISMKQLLSAMRFYYKIEFPEKIKVRSVDAVAQLKAFSRKFGRFLTLAGERTELLKLNTELGFVSEVYQTLQKGRVCLYFFGIYLRAQEEKSGRAELREICNKIAQIDCLWVNCLLYVVRGARTYYAANELLKHLSVLNGAMKSLFQKPVLQIRTGKLNGALQTLNILKACELNCRMFAADDECALSDFIEREKLCVAPHKGLNEKLFAVYRMALQEHGGKDNVRCLGQKLICNTKAKAVRLLMAAEWIDAAVSIEFEFADGTRAETYFQVADFPKRGTDGIDLGEAYDEARYKAFDHVYARAIDIPFGEEKQLSAIYLPNNSHLHLLAAVAVL